MVVRILSLLLLCCTSCIADEIWVSWELSDAPGVIGYRVYVSQSPMPEGQPLPFYNYYLVVEAGDTNLSMITDLSPGTYYFRVTCYADPTFIIPPPYPDAGKPYKYPESDLSDEVNKTLLGPYPTDPLPPTGGMITVIGE